MRPFLMFMLIGLAVSGAFGQASDRRAERDLLKLQRQWLDAYEKHDADAVGRIEADGFTLTEADGKVTTKAEDVTGVRKSKPPQPDDAWDTEDVKVRLYGNTAVLTGVVISKYRNKGQLVAERYRYTDTYIKRRGKWQVVASQLTRLP